MGYCGQSGLTSCAEADSTVDADPEITTIFFVIAAFPDAASPRLTGVTFGVSYEPEELAILESDHCADFALPTEDWPDTGSGTALTWESAQTDLLVELAWFAGYAAAEETPTTFELIEHPTQGANFADDAVPSVLDAVAGFGTLGFGESGDAPCPESGEGGGAGSPQGGEGPSGVIKAVSR